MTALAILPSRCVVCARRLLSAESRERGVGPECAELLVPSAPADWRAAERTLKGVVAPRDMPGHWGRSAARVVSRLVLLAASLPSLLPPVRRAVEALGCRGLAAAMGSRTPRSALAKTRPELRRAAFRRAVVAGRLHPDQGGDVTAFVDAARALLG